MLTLHMHAALLSLTPFDNTPFDTPLNPSRQNAVSSHRSHIQPKLYVSRLSRRTVGQAGDKSVQLLCALHLFHLCSLKYKE